MLGCEAYHLWLRADVARFRRHTTYVGCQRFDEDEFGPAQCFEMRNCPRCCSTIAVEVPVGARLQGGDGDKPAADPLTAELDRVRQELRESIRRAEETPGPIPEPDGEHLFESICRASAEGLLTEGDR